MATYWEQAPVGKLMVQSTREDLSYETCVNDKMKLWAREASKAIEVFLLTLRQPIDVEQSIWKVWEPVSQYVILRAALEVERTNTW